MYLKPEFRKTSSADYWKARRATRPSLVKISGFWIEFETSSLAAERVYGIIRRMGLPGRGSMSPDAFRREIFFRVNREALEKLLKDKQAEIAALLGAAKPKA